MGIETHGLSFGFQAGRPHAGVKLACDLLQKVLAYDVLAGFNGGNFKLR